MTWQRQYIGYIVQSTSNAYVACPFAAVLPYTNTGDTIQYQAFNNVVYQETTTTVGTVLPVSANSFSVWTQKTVGAQLLRLNIAFSFTFGTELATIPPVPTAVNVTIWQGGVVLGAVCQQTWSCAARSIDSADPVTVTIVSTLYTITIPYSKIASEIHDLIALTAKAFATTTFYF